jgi:hypothetical protein
MGSVLSFLMEGSRYLVICTVFKVLGDDGSLGWVEKVGQSAFEVVDGQESDESLSNTGEEDT